MRRHLFFKKACIFTVILSLAVLSFGGCKGGDDTAGTFDGDVSFPLKEPVTLTYWVPLGGSVGVIDDFSQMGMYKELEKKTNVKIKFIHPVESQLSEQFNIMIASGTYPDIIDGMSYYSGGLTKAYNDGIIVRLNDLIDRYAPNLKKIYETYPALLPYVLDENGDHFVFPSLKGGAVLRQGNGPIFRKDWLEKLNLSVPETIDDWTNTLRAFKNNMNAKRPLILTTKDLKKDILIGAFGIKYDFYVDNGKVKYGPYEQNYKEYLKLLKQWYDEGLLDKEFGTLNTKMIDSSILNNEGGAYIGVLGNGLQRYLTLTTDPSFALQPVPYPVLHKGDSQTIETLASIVGSKNCAITTACKNPEIAAAWLDYAYSKEGSLICNFGVEGESYTMENGYPTFTKLLTNNPEGKPFSTMGRMYARSFSVGPFVLDTRYGEQFFSMDVQKEAVDVWGKYAKEAEEASHEYLGTLNPDEISQTTSKMNQIQTYADEYFIKFILGNASLDEFDRYLAEMKNMKMDEILAVYQQAYDRFIQKYPNYKIPYDTDISEIYRK